MADRDDYRAFDLRHGDCLDVMRSLADSSIDSIVTDPPYALTAGKRGGSGEASLNVSSPAGRARIGTGGGFMGKTWDAALPGVDVWTEALRVAKPGAHLLAFGGTRTFHRLTCAIEDAGWEIRDCIMWVYSSGFPKSHNLDNFHGDVFCGCESEAERDVRRVPEANVSAAVDAGPQQREILQSGVPEQGAPARPLQCAAPASGCAQSSMEGRGDVSEAPRQLCECQVCAGARVGAADGAEGRVRDGASTRDGGMVRSAADEDGDGSPRRPQPTEQRQDESGTVAGQPEPQVSGAWPICGGCGKPRIPRGLGTALKPAWEPIIVARKPLAGTVAANVETHGVGALNIDGCRIGVEPTTRARTADDFGRLNDDGWEPKAGTNGSDAGRWPANLVHDGSDEVVALFPREAGAFAPVRGTEPSKPAKNTYGEFARGGGAFHNDAGSAARFFYCAKATREDRNEGLAGMERRALNWSAGTQSPGTFQSPGTDRASENHHPTVKPTALMRWLCRLVTPPGGLVFDPFMGSGSTGKAARLEGFRFIGCDREAEYVEIARRRITHANEQPQQAAMELSA